MKPFVPIQRHIEKALEDISSDFSMSETSKENINAWLGPIRRTAPWPEVHCSRWEGIFSAYVRSGLYHIEWTRHNLGLSYFGVSHTVHWSGSTLQLNSQLGPPHTWLLLKLWSKFRNFSELLLPFPYCALSMSSYSATHHFKMLKSEREIPQPQQDNKSLAKYHLLTRNWKTL